eukprot:13374099-Ditylum_brightwellii.AAC.1
MQVYNRWLCMVDKVGESCKTVRYWKIWKSDTLNKTTCPLAAVVQKELNINDNTNNNINNINAQLAVARKELKKVQKNVTSIRDKQLTQMVAMLLSKQKGDIAAIFKNINICEETWLAFKQIRSIIK